MSAPNTNKDSRRFCRYKVSDLPVLFSQVDRSRRDERIVTIGEGGCGFYGFDPTWPMNPAQRIYPRFQWLGDHPFGPLETQAKIIYVKPMILNEQKVFFYGLEFLPSYRSIIRPLIEELELLKSTGKVKVDL